MLCIAKHMPILRIRHQNTAIWNGMCVFQFSLCIIKRLSVASFTVHFFERLNDKKIFAHTFEWWLRTNVSILPNFNRPTQTYNFGVWVFGIMNIFDHPVENQSSDLRHIFPPKENTTTDKQSKQKKKPFHKGWPSEIAFCCTIHDFESDKQFALSILTE